MNWEFLYNCIIIAWWLTNFQPIVDFVNNKIKPKVPDKWNYIRNALTCWKCVSFNLIWILAFIIHKEFYFMEAATAALIVYTYERIINSFKMYF